MRFQSFTKETSYNIYCEKHIVTETINTLVFAVRGAISTLYAQNKTKLTIFHKQNNRHFAT